MLLYTRNLIPKIPARILGKHLSNYVFEDLRKPKAPNSYLEYFSNLCVDVLAVYVETALIVTD
jgi:hypothetical protein